MFAPPSPFFKNVKCVRETEILVEQQPPQGVLSCDDAGLVINKLSHGAIIKLSHGVGQVSSGTVGGFYFKVEFHPSSDTGDGVRKCV